MLQPDAGLAPKSTAQAECTCPEPCTHDHENE
jgi:hypothetical protein